MPQLVFLHGPGAGACADAFHYQLKHFPGALAPNLPGHLEGRPCPDVKSYTEWLRGWLWAQGKTRDLVLSGYTLGACIALQYALDYPEEVKGLVISTVAMRAKVRAPGAYDLRKKAIAGDPQAYAEWKDFMIHISHLIEPGLREQLLERHWQIGPASQLHDFQVIDAFDVRERIAALRPPLVVVRGLNDPGKPPEYEKEIHDAVPGSRYVKIEAAGHFPPTETPGEFNRLVEELLAGLG